MKTSEQTSSEHEASVDRAQSSLKKPLSTPASPPSLRRTERPKDLEPFSFNCPISILAGVGQCWCYLQYGCRCAWRINLGLLLCSVLPILWFTRPHFFVSSLPPHEDEKTPKFTTVLKRRCQACLTWTPRALLSTSIPALLGTSVGGFLSPLKHRIPHTSLAQPHTAAPRSSDVQRPTPCDSLPLSVAAFLTGIATFCLCGRVLLFVSYPARLLSRFDAVSQQMENSLNFSTKKLGANGYGVERFRVGPRQLDTVVIHHRTPGVQRWVLYLGGNGEFMEHSVGRAEPLLERVAAHEIYYNPRGVSNSGGGRVVRLGDLVEDAMAVVRWAMREYGIAAQNVLLLGHSIGGGVAGEVVRHPEFRECALVVDRSFTRLSDAASGMVGVPAGVMRAMYGALRVGDLDTMKGWDAAHDGRKLVIYSTEDRVIRFKCASPGRLAQFCPGGKDEGRSIGLTKDSFRLMDWHNDPLEAFGNAEEVFRRINRLFDSSPSLR